MTGPLAYSYFSLQDDLLHARKRITAVALYSTDWMDSRTKVTGVVTGLDSHEVYPETFY